MDSQNDNLCDNLHREKALKTLMPQGEMWELINARLNF